MNVEARTDEYQTTIFHDGAFEEKQGEYVHIGSDAQVLVVDSLASQKAELDKLIPSVSDAMRSEPARWVYYPWRRSIVRTLGPIGFRRLRLDRNRNKITEAEQDRFSSLTVSVIGLSVGHAVAFALAQEGLCGCLRLADLDELDVSNLNRVPATLIDAGVAKTVLLARRIAEIDPDISVELFHEGATEENIGRLVDGADLVVDECDALDIKFLLRFRAKERAIPVLMQTSDGGILDVERFDLEPQRPIFHGLVDVPDLAALTGLSNADKVPLIMAILEVDQVTARMGASLIEMDDQVTTWPQLASDVSLGAGMVGAAVRRWGLGQPLPSGRLRLDLDLELASITMPDKPQAAVSMDVDKAPRADGLAAVLLDAAQRAPSGGNAQPWAFEVDDESFNIFFDPTRSTGIDIGSRGSFLALGAALYNVEVAAAAESRSGTTILPTRPLTPEQLSGTAPVCSLSLGSAIDADLANLVDLIPQRCCSRVGGESDPLDNRWMRSSTATARASDADIVFLTGEAKDAAAEIWAEADRIRFLDQQLHAEMMSELRWPGDDLTTGIDICTLELGALDLSVLSLIRRTDVMAELSGWQGGAKLGDSSKGLIREAHALAVVTAPGPTDGDFVRGGRILERFWLDATRQKVGLHPLSPLFLYALDPTDLAGIVSPCDAEQMWDLRVRFAELCGFRPDQPIALTLRATTQQPSAIRSLREPSADRRLQTKA